MLVTSRNNSYGRNTYLPTWSLLSFALLKALLLTLATSVSVTLLSRGASNLCTGGAGLSSAVLLGLSYLNGEESAGS